MVASPWFCARMVRTSSIGLITLLGLVVPLGSAPALAACDDSELCAPGASPCIVDRARCLPAGTTIDVRPRPLQVNRRVTIGEGAEAVFIRAADVTIAPAGGFEITGEPGAQGIGGELHLEATGRIWLQASGNTRARIDANGGLQGGIIVLDAGADVTELGTITANATSALGAGGLVRMTSATGSVRIGTGGISATGGSNGGEGATGGEIAVAAATSVLVEGAVDASNGDCFGCTVSLEARAGDLTLTPTAVVSASASGGFGDGGSVVLDAAGAVIVDGTVRAVAKGSGGENGGAGTAGSVDVVALADVRVAGEVDLAGTGPDGDAGRIDVDAGGELAIPGRVRLDTQGGGFGGDAFLVATSFTLTGQITGHGEDFGGSVDVLAETTALVGGMITAGGSWRSGTIQIEACTLSLPGTASLVTTGGPALGARGVTLSGGDSLTIAGDVASTGPIRLAYRAALPAVLPGASITPSPELFLDESLACCGSCPASTTTTSSSTSTSSTTSSTSSSTSTSATTSSSIGSSTSTTSTTRASTSSTATSSTSPTSSVTSTSSSTSTSSITTVPPSDPCSAAAAPAEELVRCSMRAAGVLLEAEAPTSTRGVRGVRRLRTWARKIDARLTAATTERRRKRALGFTARGLRRMGRLVARAAQRGDVSTTLATRLPRLLAEAQAIIGDAASS